MFNRKTLLASTAVAALAPETETGTEQPGIGHNQPPSDDVEYNAEALVAKALHVAEHEDEETSQAVERLAAARGEVSVGALCIMLAMVANHGEEEMATWPIPDSDTGTNPDKFKREQTVDGKVKKVPVVWWNLYADSTPTGKALLQRKEWLQLAGKDGANKSGIPEDILDMNSVKRSEAIDLVDGRITSNRNGHKEAGKLFFQFQAVRSLTEVDCAPVWDNEEEGTVERTKKPIMVWRVPAVGTNGQPQPITHFRHMSIGAFLRLDVPKAQENGGTYKALIATVDRGTGAADSNTGGKEATPVIKTVETGASRTVEVHRWMNEIHEDKTQADLGRLIKTLKHKDADELVVAFVELEQMLHSINTDAGAYKRYADIQKNKPELTNLAGPANTKAA